MAMKKAEMEEHRAEYRKRMRRARVAERDGLFRDAVFDGHIDLFLVSRSQQVSQRKYVHVRG